MRRSNRGILYYLLDSSEVLRRRELRAIQELARYELLENHKPLQSEKLMNLLWEHFEGQVEPEEDDGTNQTQLVEDVELNLELAMEPLHNSVPLRME